MKNLFAALILLITSAAQAQVVNTQFGQVQGTQNGNVYQFLGIPFAKPPVGNLRWKAPENPDSWSGILTTTDFAPVCPQKNYTQGDTTFTIEGNEDCLYLNVWTPQTGAAGKAVMVFIHGGGNQQGGASEVSGGTELYFGKNMAERGDVVVVTIQYRLGPLGFLVHPGLEAESATGKAGNYAVLDQILALQWVHNNIANFGGDPDNVLIFGESAGGVNTGNLLLTPLATGLFHRACIESASPTVDVYNNVKSKGIAYVDSFNISGTDVQKIATLRTLPADSILYFEESPLQGGVVQMNWRAAMDGVVFTNYPMQAVQSGNFNHVPLMIGSNSDEMSLSAPATVTPTMVNLLLYSMVPSSLITQAQSLYPAGSTNAEARASYVGILTDAQFTATTRRVAQCVSQNQHEPVWRYFYTYKHSLSQLATYGAYHGMELFYVFNNWENATLGSGSLFHASDDSVQQVMLNYWTNFAKTGDPNGANLVNWPQYQAANDCYLELKATPDDSQCGIRTAKCDLWDDVSNFTPCTSSLGLSEISGTNPIRVAPNPTTDLLSIQFPEATENYIVNVYDLQGKLLFSQQNQVQIDLTTRQNGVYLLEVINQQGEIFREKVVKE